jgi:hypothetical protein
MFWPLACILANIYASSTVTAAQGILGYLGSYSIYPVWTEEIDYEATDLTSIALAPYFAAMEGPSTRY